VSAFGNGQVIAADIQLLAPALYCADDYCIVPRSDSPKFIPHLLDLCAKRNIRLLVPTRDEELPVFAKARDTFEAAGTAVLTADLETIRICQDKFLFSRFCNEHHFHTPRILSRQEIQKNSFPLFVKPRFGKGSKDAQMVCSVEALDFYLSKIESPLVQEYIDAKEYTVDLFVDFENTVISVVPRERISVFGGESFVSKTYLHPKIIEEATKLATSLALKGPSTIQCFFKEGIVIFVEVNPRFGGAVNCSFEAGAPTPLFLLKLLNGEKIEPVVKLKNDFTMLRYTEDIFI
jgi:carbamoyl-phosphate synthase large subunit